MTLLGAVCAIAANVSQFEDRRWAACILFTMYHMLDNMDGKHARRTGQSSEFGAILDHFVDGTAGIWSGAVGLQYALGISNETLTFGVWSFAFLFWCVHIVHAMTGFFELGNDFLSIDEAFVALSLIRALYAMNVPMPALLKDNNVHLVIVGFIICMGFHWLLTHGRNRISKTALKKNFHLVVAYGVYVVASYLYLPAYSHTIWGPIYALAGFTIPYGMVLWESKNKH